MSHAGTALYDAKYASYRLYDAMKAAGDLDYATANYYIGIANGYLDDAEVERKATGDIIQQTISILDKLEEIQKELDNPNSNIKPI